LNIGGKEEGRKRTAWNAASPEKISGLSKMRHRELSRVEDDEGIRKTRRMRESSSERPQKLRLVARRRGSPSRKKTWGEIGRVPSWCPIGGNRGQVRGTVLASSKEKGRLKGSQGKSRSHSDWWAGGDPSRKKAGPRPSLIKKQVLEKETPKKNEKKQHGGEKWWPQDMPCWGN